MKLGRKAARYTTHSLRRYRVMAAALDALGVPPLSSYDYTVAVKSAVGDDWGMMGNDQLGDCTCADCGHQLMLRTANAGKILIPSTQSIIDLYENFGYDPANPNTDEGADELTVMQFLRTRGLLCHTIDAYANIDPHNLAHLKWVIEIYGASRLGVNLPSSAEDQFNANQPWVPVKGATLAGGHDVPLVRYETSTGQTQYWCVTWGRLQPVSEAFLLATFDDGTPYVEEAHAEAADDLMQVTGFTPVGYDHDQLMADLAAVSQ